MENERMDRREMVAEGLEVREAEGGAPMIVGYAVVFNVWSRKLYDWSGRAFVERFDPAAFDGWLRSKPELVALWNHNADIPLGRLSAGTLRVAKDARGLRFEIDPPPNSWGQDALIAIRRGDVGGMSFLFEAIRDAWGKPGADGVSLRTVLESALHEISPVTFPAYPDAQVSVRSVRVPDFEETEADGRAAADIDFDDRQWAALLEVRRRRLDLYRRLQA